jgi:hypothetical protein
MKLFELDDENNPLVELMRKAIEDCTRNLAMGAESHMRERLTRWCYSNVAEWIELAGMEITEEVELQIQEEIGNSLDFHIRQWQQEAEAIAKLKGRK